MTYCLVCKKKTKAKNIRIEKAKNGKFVEKSTCDVCGKNKSKFIKSQSGGALDIHKAILKVAPKKGFVIYGLETVVSVLFTNTRTRWLHNE